MAITPKKDIPIGGVYVGKLRKFSVDEYGRTLYKVKVSSGGIEKDFQVTKLMAREVRKIAREVNRLPTMTERMASSQSFLRDYDVLSDRLQISMFKTNFLKQFNSQSGMSTGMYKQMMRSRRVSEETKEDLTYIVKAIKNMTTDELLQVYNNNKQLFKSLGEYYSEVRYSEGIPDSEVPSITAKNLQVQSEAIHDLAVALGRKA